jgi:hypothetical protein
MLSDDEARTLRELERRLRDDDPEFPRRFDARAQRLERRHVGMPVVVMVAFLFGGVSLIAGAPGAALALITVTALVWLAWRWCRATPSDGDVRDDHHPS